MWCGFWKPRRKFGHVAGRIWLAQTNHFQTFCAGCKNWCGFWKPRMFQGLAILSHLEHKEYEDDGFAQNPLNCDWVWVSGNPIAIQVLNGGVEAWLTVALWFGVFFIGAVLSGRAVGCVLWECALASTLLHVSLMLGLLAWAVHYHQWFLKLACLPANTYNYLKRNLAPLETCSFSRGCCQLLRNVSCVG